MSDNNLEDLRVGDEVAFYGKFGEKSIKKIRRLTPKSIVLVNEYQLDKDGSAFWKKDGIIVSSDSYNFTMIRKVTQEFRDKINLDNKVKHLRSLIERTSFDKLGLDKLDKLIEILEVNNGKE